MPNLSGKILIAQPKLPDPVFGQSLIVMLKHSEQGATGLILNKTSKITVTESWEGLTLDPSQAQLADSLREALADNEEFVHLGGPVYGPLMCLHSCQEHAEQEVADGLYWSADTPCLVEIVKSGKPFRLYNGYAGWTPGQIENEMKSGAWVVGENLNAAELTFTTQPECSDIWKSVLSNLARKTYLEAGIPEAFLDNAENN